MASAIIVKTADFSTNKVSQIEFDKVGISAAVSPSGSGSVAITKNGTTISGNIAYVEDGDVVVLTATAESGYRFLKWNDDDVNVTKTITVNSSTQSTTYTAIFEEYVTYENDCYWGLGGIKTALISSNVSPNSLISTITKYIHTTSECTFKVPPTDHAISAIAIMDTPMAAGGNLGPRYTMFKNNSDYPDNYRQYTVPSGKYVEIEVQKLDGTTADMTASAADGPTVMAIIGTYDLNSPS